MVVSAVELFALGGRDGTRCSLLRGIAGRVRKTVADQVDDEGFAWQWPPHPVGSVGEASCSGCDGSTGLRLGLFGAGSSDGKSFERKGR